MSAEPFVLSGVVREGVIVPEVPLRLPEGSHVQILVANGAVPPELIAEFEAWEHISDEAWSMIDDWEKAEKA